MLMQSPSPSCSPLEQALRKYPSLVPQASQNAVRSSGDKEFKYARSFSIPSLYSNVNDSSTIICTPVIYIQPPPIEYPAMGEDSVVEIRRARLKRVIEDRYRGIQANMVRDTGINAGELSGLLKTRFFGEKKARTLERQIGLSDMWLDGVDVSESGLIDDFMWILEHGASNERSILLATIEAIKTAHKQSPQKIDPTTEIKDRLPEDEPNDFTRAHVRKVRQEIGRRKQNKDIEVENNRRQAELDRRKK